MKALIYSIFVAGWRFERRLLSARTRIWLGVTFRRAYWASRLRSVGSKTRIGSDVVIHHPDLISIGDECSIAEFVHMWGGGGVTIGDSVLIASHVAITSMSHDVYADVFANTSTRGAVVIEDNVWIGAGAQILPGVRLGKGCIVGAGAVVTTDVPSRTVVAGIPAKKLRSIADSEPPGAPCVPN